MDVKVRTHHTSNHQGASIVVVKWDGRQKTVHRDYSRSDVHVDAIERVFGKNIDIIEQQSRDHGNRRVFLVTTK